MLIVLLWALIAAGAVALVFLVTVAVQTLASAGPGRRVARIEADTVRATRAVNAITVDAEARIVQVLMEARARRVRGGR